MSEPRLSERLREVIVPEGPEAEERGWRVVHGAFEARHPVHLKPRLNRLALALAAALLVAGIALSPAGAKVADVVRDVVEPGADNAQPALTSLPASGELLVTSPEGPWIVDQDGSQRLLGTYHDAAWSPSGMFAVVARRHQLTAVDPVGAVRWSLAAPRPVSNPAWSPSGIRVAYLSGSSLRVVAGDGKGDRPLADGVAAVAPAWRPLSEPLPSGQVAIGPKTNVLAYADRRGRVTLRDVDSDQVLWRSHGYGMPIRELQWSADRGRLLVRTASAIELLDPRGRVISKAKWSTYGASIAPDSDRTAFIRRATAGRSEVLITRRHKSGPLQHVLSREGRITDPTWSPDGKWLLVARPAADHWLFIRPSRRVRVETVGSISRQFAPAASGRAGFPRISGWCCAR